MSESKSGSKCGGDHDGRIHGAGVPHVMTVYGWPTLEDLTNRYIAEAVEWFGSQRAASKVVGIDPSNIYRREQRRLMAEADKIIALRQAARQRGPTIAHSQ